MIDSNTLIEAIQQGASDRVARLLEETPELAGAKDAQGTSALMLALYHGRPEIAEMLAAGRAAFSLFELAALGRTAELASALEEDKEALDNAAGDGFRLLGLACFFGREPAVELLLARGADPNLVADNPMRVAALHSAVAFRDPEVALRIARLLLAHGARPDTRQHGGWTALHSAAMHGHESLVRLLIEHGAATDLESEDGRTPGAMAEAEGHDEVIRLLTGVLEGVAMDLRYPVGEFVVPPSLTPDQRAAALAVLAHTPARLRAAVSGLTEDQLDTPYRPDGWSVRQVVHHLPDSHLNSFIRFKLGLTEDVPTIGTYDEKAWAELPDARGPIDVSLRLLEALHERWVALLKELDDDSWQRLIDHPEIGRLRLDQLLALYEWHSRHHLAHISSLRDRQGW